MSGETDPETDPAVAAYTCAPRTKPPPPRSLHHRSRRPTCPRTRYTAVLRRRPSKSNRRTRSLQTCPPGADRCASRGLCRISGGRAAATRLAALCGGGRGQATRSPTTSHHVAIRSRMVERYLAAVRRWRRGRSRLPTRVNASRKRRAESGDLNRRMTRSRTRVGWCACSTRLLHRIAARTCRCSAPANSGSRAFAAA